jgi:hypothetical protein
LSTPATLRVSFRKVQILLAGTPIADTLHPTD